MKKALEILWILMILVIALSIISSCFSYLSYNNDPIATVDLYKDTPAWELAKAVNSQNTFKIKRILKNNPELADFKDAKFGMPILVWSIGMAKYNSSEALLKGGADPNIICDYYGATALYLSVQSPWFKSENSSKWVKLLLDYGADPNMGCIGIENDDFNQSEHTYTFDVSGYTFEQGVTPLMQSIGFGIEKTKVLVDAGADINAKSKVTNRTATIEALQRLRFNFTYDSTFEYLYYLIVEKKADITSPYYIVDEKSSEKKEYFPVDELRYCTPELDSKEYDMKMEIVDEFKRQGVDYWSAEIPEEIVVFIKERYPDNWEYYLENY